MFYDSLLLNNGGGVVSATQKSEQFGGAALCIGIGGTGVDALAQLKRKVYQQLEPDDPSSPIPKYKHIQFLAIDSDTSAFKGVKGVGRLTEDEAFSIEMPNLAAALKNKEGIKQKAELSWMSIDAIEGRLSTQGAGGVRQVGRFLLISKVDELKSKIASLCKTALESTDPNLDVYIFAGISGGTGSGCFLDTCYIVRQALAELGRGSTGNIMGFFFLPDVVTSKKEVAANPLWVKSNNSNGYAALKELDYLMNLKAEQDCFRQNYGSFQIDTDEPPVTMCHLLSAQKSNGKIIPNGYGYCINVAADYVISYLAKVDIPAGVEAGKDDGGLTMRGHLSNVTRGVEGLPRNYGANLSYHILGASNAEIPMSQIATYLAAGFYKRFEESIGRNKVVIPEDELRKRAAEMGLTVENLENRMRAGSNGLMLPDMDFQQLRNFGPMQKGQLNSLWYTAAGTAWLSECKGLMEKNRAVLNGVRTSNCPSKNSSDSLIGTIFKKLAELAEDPNYGPYYAAALLHQEGEDLIAWVRGLKKTVEEECASLQNITGNYDDTMVQASADFCFPPKKFGILHESDKVLYGEYKSATEQLIINLNEIALREETAKMLENLMQELQNLDNEFFKVLVDLMDGLDETFRENQNYLNGDKAKATAAYTWRILELSEMKSHLDEIIKNLTPKQLVTDFMTEVLQNPDEWLKNEDSQIGAFISRYMERVFKSDMDRSLQDYLYIKYPRAKGPADLSDCVKDDILKKVYEDSIPMFWNDEDYPILDASVTFQSCSLSVPASASAVCQAADDFRNTMTNCAVRKTGLKDRIFVLRFVSGVPIHAYKGVTLLKKYYDEAASSKFGIGSHLYEDTGRSDSSSINENWRTYLPTPMAYSFGKNRGMFDSDVTGKQVEQYERARDCKTILLDKTKNGQEIYQLRTSVPLVIPQYKREDFETKSGTFNEKKYKEEQDKLDDWLEHRYDPDKLVESTDLSNDGNRAIKDERLLERVRLDYFLHYPVLQQKVCKELEAYDAVVAAKAKLEEIHEEFDAYAADLKLYSELIYYGILKCLNSSEKSALENTNEKIAKIQYTYMDGRMPKILVLSDQAVGETYPFAGKYALYQGFVNYRALDAFVTPRKELDKSAQEKRRAAQTVEEVKIARVLEQRFDTEHLAALDVDTATLVPEQKNEIMRFYIGLAQQISNYRDSVGETLWNQNTAASQKAYWISYNGKTMSVSEPSWNWAWDSTMNNWVQLMPNTPLYYYNGQTWVPTQTDAQGNVHIQ